MQTSRPKTNQKPHLSDFKAHLVMALFGIVMVTAVVVVAPLMLYQHFNTPIVKDFDLVNQEMEKIRTDIMNPAESIEDIRAASLVRNNILNPLDCIDVACPHIHRAWFVPMPPGDELEFSKYIVSKEGYSLTSESQRDCTQDYKILCSVIGEKEGYVVLANVGELGAIKPPNKDISPKEWRYVVVRIEKR